MKSQVAIVQQFGILAVMTVAFAASFVFMYGKSRKVNTIAVLTGAGMDMTGKAGWITGRSILCEIKRKT